MYATIENFIEVRGELESIRLSNLDEPGAETINNDVLQKALDNGGAEINGYLAIRYTVPIVPAPAILQKYEIIIARKDLDRYNRGEFVQKDYENAIASLKRMARGEEAIIANDENGNPSVIPSNEDSKNVTFGTVGYGHAPRTITRQWIDGYGRNTR